MEFSRSVPMLRRNVHAAPWLPMTANRLDESVPRGASGAGNADRMQSTRQWGLRSGDVNHEPAGTMQIALNKARSIARYGGASRRTCGASPPIELRHR